MPCPSVPPLCRSRDFATMCFREFGCALCYVCGRKVCLFRRLLLIDVGVLIRPGDAQKYVSRRSFELFSFVTLYLFRVRVASFLYCVIFSCTNRRKNVLQNKHLQCTILFMVFFNSSFQIWSTAAAYGGPYGELCGFF